MSPMFVCAGVGPAKHRIRASQLYYQSKNLFTLEASLSNVTKCFPDLYGYSQKAFSSFTIEYLRTDAKIIKIVNCRFLINVPYSF